MRQRGLQALCIHGIVLFAIAITSACSGLGTATPTPAIPVDATQPGPLAVTATVAPGANGAAGASPTAAATSAVAAGTAISPSAAPQATTPAANPQSGVPAGSVTAFPNAAGYTWAQVGNGLIAPTDLAAPADGSGRLLVLEQAGVIRVVAGGNTLPAPFLDITDRVGRNGSERGLLGIALHPNYTKNGFFYVNYTDQNGNTVIARFTVSSADPNRADPASEKVILHVQQPYPNHNGGSMVFGPDGYLYMGLGDGGSQGDPNGNGQSTDTLLGKLLRIDVNNGDPYTIPDSNPFKKGGGKPEIWAYGLRNPWRFSFDRLTGDLYIADVGQDKWEEIDFLPAGAPGGTNFGWNYREGKHPYKGNPPAGLKLTEPVYDYSHSEGCSVIGGFVYRGESLPEFRGIYLFTDYCSGTIWGMLRDASGAWQTQTLFQQSGMNISSFGQDANGEIYILDQASGAVYRLQHQ